MFKALVLSLLSSLVLASPILSSPAVSRDLVHEFSKRRPLPPLPGNDPWYAAPSNLASLPLGSIIKWRPGPRPISLDNVNSIKVQGLYQIQYRTQNAAGLPLANVLTAIVPYNPNYDALFSYIYFSDSPSPDWNPSFDMTLVPGGEVVWTKQQLGPVISALNQGWIVGVPDDGGPYADFPSGPTSAYTTLDSMRALLQSREITGLLPSATITLNGYSGGGVTAAWVAEIHPAYAPEINIAGIALGGLVPKFKWLADTIRARKGYNHWGAVTFVGLSHAYPQLSAWLDRELKPETAKDLWEAEKLSIGGIQLKYADLVTCDFFKRGCDAWDDKIVVDILRNSTENGLGRTPTAPWYLYSTANDEISPIQMTRDLFDDYCARGANILFEETPAPISHAIQSVVNFPGALQWMKERHNRVPIVPGCLRTPISMQSIMSGWPFSITDPLIQTFTAQFDSALGPNTPGIVTDNPVGLAQLILESLERVLFGVLG